MENPFDSFFKNKLEQKNWQPSEANWQDALALIRREKQKKKRRIFFFWFSTAAGILLLSAGLWLRLKTEIPAGKMHAEQNQSAPQAALPVEKSANDSPEKVAEKIAQKNTATQTDSDYIPALTEQRASSKFEKENTSKNTGLTAQKMIPTAPEIATPANAEIGEEKFFENKNDLQIHVAPEAAPLTLPADIAYLEFPGLQLFELQDVKFSSFEAAPKIEVLKNKSLRFGLTGGAFFNPAFSKNEKNLLGFNAGFYAEKLMNDDWSAVVKLLYLQRFGTFEATQKTTQETYAFGLTKKQEMLRPTVLHYLNVPIEIHYKIIEKHRLGAGVFGQILLGTEAEKQVTEEISAPDFFAKTSTEKGSIEKPEMLNPQNFGLSFLYEYNLRVLCLGLKGNYFLNPVFKNQNQEQILSENDRLILEAYIKIPIFKIN
ncbi:MAG TPA: porin family protein [Saprospiraceae bacterium]|nr:porin family protein [Saprospiraceae bacterium]